MSTNLQKTKVPGIYRRGSRYVATFRDQHGTPRKKSAATLAEAKALKAACETDVRRGDYQTYSSVKFADYAREWAASYQGRTSRGIRPETLKDYQADLERHAIPHLGQLQLAQIEPRDLKQLAAHLSQKGLSAKTVRCVFAPIKALLATAYEDGLTPRNPAAGLRLSQPGSRQTAQKRKALTEPELQRFLHALPTQEWQLFFELLTHTGLRISEAIALEWDDIDLPNRQLHVRRRRYRNRNDTPKSDYGLRTIPLAPGLTQKLWRHRATHPGRAIAFTTATGNYLDPTKIRYRTLKPAAHKAGLPWLGFHSFRHTCATTLFNHGLNAIQVQHWLGHHSPAFTLNTYIHLLPNTHPNPDFLDHITTPTTANTVHLPDAVER